MNTSVLAIKYATDDDKNIPLGRTLKPCYKNIEEELALSACLEVIYEGFASGIVTDTMKFLL